MSRYDFSSILKTVGRSLRVPNTSTFAICAECSPLWQRRAAVQAALRHAPTSMSGSPSGRAFSMSARREDPSALSKRSITDLGEKAEMEIGMRGRLASVVPPRRCKEVSHRVGSKFGGAHSLKWTTPPKTVLLAKKSNDPKTTAAAKRIVRHLLDDYDGLSVMVEKEVFNDLRAATEADDQALLQQLVVLEEADKSDLVSKVDLVVTLGGDGTVLHVASLFANGAVPPILGVSMGTLGFLMPFNLKQFKGAFREVMQSEASLLLRMRLQCAIHDASGELVSRNDDTGSQALNEVHLHRGRHPHLTIIETFVDGQHLTEAISDGLIVSTPTGSTAYSLSAGGPIVHPSVPSLLLTPICPRSLSFRSVLLPSDVCIQMRISPKSRAPAELSLDGRSVQFLEPGEYLSVSMSRYPVPCIVPTSKITTPGIPQSVLCKPQQAQVDTIAGEKEGRGANSGQDEVLDGGWVQDINGMLSFNKAFVTKGMMKHIGDD